MNYGKQIKCRNHAWDVNGISYELIIKLLAENRICELCVPILYGSPKVAAYYRKVLNIENFSLNTIREPGEANGNDPISSIAWMIT